VANTELDFKIPSLKDDIWINQAEKATELAAKIPGAQQPRVSLTALGKQYQADPNNPDWLSELREKLASADGHYISSISIQLTVPGTSAQQQGQVSFSITRIPAEPVATLKVTIGQHTADALDKLTAINTVVAEFQPIDPVESKISLATDDAAEYLRQLDNKLQQLSNVAIEQTEKVTENLREQALRNQQTLDTEREKLQADFDAKQDELKKREDILTNRVKDIDLADAKTSRRKLRDQLKEKLDRLAGELKFTNQTNIERRVLYGVLAFGLIVGAIIIIEAGLAMTKPDATTGNGAFLIGARATAGSILFGSVLIYFIRWQSAWVHQRTMEELRLLRTSLDVERASWVVESLVEFKNEQIDQIPDALLTAVTRNLFADPEQNAAITTPVDDVADILRNGAESVKLKLGDHEVVLDRRSLKKLSAAQNAD
jgi:hypothetical protein